MAITLEQTNEILNYAESYGVQVNATGSYDESELATEAICILLDAYDNKEKNMVAKEIWGRFGHLAPQDELVSPKQLQSKNNNADEVDTLPLPPYVDIDDVPEMPADLTLCSDEQIRRLHSVFHAYFIRTNWLVGLQENETKNLKFAERQLYNKEILSIDPFYREGTRAPKEKTKAIVEAEAYQNEKLSYAAESLKDAENKLNQLKTLRDIYESNVSRLSRESSMRFSEIKHS